MLSYDRRLRDRSQQLRNERTPAERFLWLKIRGRRLNGFWFYRQKPVGVYIADFYCPKAKLVIEVDGGQHSANEVKEYDKARSEYMKSIGLSILRFTNTEVLANIKSVLETIYNKMLE
jgi:very-short-patch-repair endonuclease